MRKIYLILVILFASLAIFLGTYSPVSAAKECDYFWASSDCNQNQSPYCADGTCSLSG